MFSEKNIEQFNSDVDSVGSYIYTQQHLSSTVIARKHQSDEFIKSLRTYFKKNPTILEAGCGDGIFALDLLEQIHPKEYFGFDASKKGVSIAKKRIPKKYTKKVRFQTIDIYQIDKHVQRSDYDVTLIWGVLHHLYNPEEGIRKLCLVSDHIIVCEPNGYNPLLKIIEKISPYHRAHEEKSYPPFRLHRWFRENGFELVEGKYYGIVPYFSSSSLASILKKIEPFVEKIPLLNIVLSGSNQFYYRRVKQNEKRKNN